MKLPDINQNLDNWHKKLKNFEKIVKNILRASYPVTESVICEIEPEAENKRTHEFNNMLLKRANEFSKNSHDKLLKQKENYANCKEKFEATTKMFSVKANQKDGEVTLEYFFTLWHDFAKEFKDAWKCLKFTKEK